MADLGIIKSIIKETKNVWRFKIESPLYDKLNYLPGQLINLYLRSPMDPPHIRSYSVSSWPDDSNEFEIIVTDQPGGLMSQLLFREAKIGTELEYSGPMGVFTLPEEIDRDLFFVCTGSGISPFRSMVNFVTKNKVKTKNIHLIYGCRTESDLLYYNELKELEKENPNFHYHCTLSREKVDGFHNGYVHPIYLDLIKDLKEKPLFYLCGWKQMITDTRTNLNSLDYKMGKDIRIEIFG